MEYDRAVAGAQFSAAPLHHLPMSIEVPAIAILRVHPHQAIAIAIPLVATQEAVHAVPAAIRAVLLVAIQAVRVEVAIQEVAHAVEVEEVALEVEVAADKPI